MSIDGHTGLQEGSLRRFLTRHLPPEVVDSEDIFADGIASSLFALQLVTFVEKEFRIVVESDDLELANFSSIPALLRFIGRKQLGN